MTAATRTIETDVCVIGAGIVGLAHAHEARRRGLSVVVLERNERAVGASVRNFGHLFFSSAAGGEASECAATARERWLVLAGRARMFVAEEGTLIVARHRDEAAVLEAAAQDPSRHARMLTAREVAELVPLPAEGVLAGYHAADDLRVDPRAAAGALAQLLVQDPHARVEWGMHVHDVEMGRVHTERLRVQAPAIVVCPGADYRSLPPSLRTGLEQLTLCQLQMLRLAAPTGRRYPPALATGLSLVRYPLFAQQTGAAELRTRLELEKGELIDRAIQLLITQLPDGDLIVGEASTYADTPSPFDEERLFKLLLDETRELLGIEPEVKQRWHGLNPVPLAPEAEPFLVTAPLPGVRVVQNTSGLGMTLSFGRAPAVLDDLVGEQEASAGLEPARDSAVPL